MNVIGFFIALAFAAYGFVQVINGSDWEGGTTNTSGKWGCAIFFAGIIIAAYFIWRLI